jgi:3-oxoacyl-[acyl-carrier protein] reductase
MNNLKGKHILFVGGCGGIGGTTVEHLLKEDLKVSVTTLPEGNYTKKYRKTFRNAIKDTDSEFSIIEADITIEKDIKRQISEAEKTFGSIDHLIITAGVSHLGKLLDVTREEWDLVFETNVWGTLRTIQETVPHLSEGAKIIVLGSDVGLGKPSHDIPLYSISKTALHSIITLLSQELPEKDISINGIAPYNTPPGMRNVYSKKNGELICEAEDPSTPDWGNLPPTGKFIDADTIAQTILCLLKVNSDLNGTIVPITGGYGLTIS